MFRNFDQVSINMANIRNNMLALVRENEQLRKEYEKLKKEYDECKGNPEKTSQEVPNDESR